MGKVLSGELSCTWTGLVSNICKSNILQFESLTCILSTDKKITVSLKVSGRVSLVRPAKLFMCTSQKGQLSVTGESMCTKYWLTA